MKRFVFFLIAVFIVICSASCKRADYCELTFFSMDTFVTLKADAGNDELLEDCRDKICVNTGKISRAGQSIVCLPARVSVAVVGNGGDVIVAG